MLYRFGNGMLGGVVELFEFKDVILSMSGHGMSASESSRVKHG